MSMSLALGVGLTHTTIPSPVNPEIVINGDLSDGDTGWTLNTGWSVVGEELVKVAGLATAAAQISSRVVTGKTYRLSVDVTLTAGTYSLKVKGTSTGNISTTGTVVVELVAGTGPDSFALSANAGYAGTMDNVSLQEVV